MRDNTKMRFWTVNISTPPKDGTSWWGTASYGVAAKTIRQAIDAAEELVPGCIVWTVSHRGTIDLTKGDE